MISVVARRVHQQITVKDVLSQAGSSRSTFYAQLADMEDCDPGDLVIERRTEGVFAIAE